MFTLLTEQTDPRILDWYAFCMTMHVERNSMRLIKGVAVAVCIVDTGISAAVVDHW